MDVVRGSFSAVKRCRKAVWKSFENIFLLSCFRRRRTSTAKRTAEDALDGVTAAVADKLTINENISATTIDINSEVQLPAAVNSSKTEEEKDLLNGVTQEEGQPRNIMDEAEKKGTAATETVRNVSPGDENNIVDGSEKPDVDNEPKGDADSRCRKKTTPAKSMSSVSLKVKHVDKNTTERSEIRKSADNCNDGASQSSQTTKNKCRVKAKVVDNREMKGDGTSHLSKPKALTFSLERIRPRRQNQQLSVGSGMINKGVICYINSTLQALFHIPAFTNWLMNEGACHNVCWRKVICKDLSTERQEDAHEFLSYMIGSIKRNCLPVSEHADEFSANVYLKEITAVSKIFGGYIRTEVTCGECANKSITCQYLQDMILDIKQSNNVRDALKDYFQGEQLLYVCGSCRREVVAEKKFFLVKAPNVLCVQLNRFNTVGTDGSYGGKINKVMEINERLELSNYMCGTDARRPLRYHLVSMVMHHGSSLNSGHYTAVCLAPTGSYYYFNDKDVYKTSFGKHSKSKNSYIMFYELDSLNCGPRNGARRKQAAKKSGTA